jgi:hypothetical protein
MKLLTAKIDYDIIKYNKYYMLIFSVLYVLWYSLLNFIYIFEINYTNILFAIAKKNGNVLARQNFLAPARRPRSIDDGMKCCNWCKLLFFIKLYDFYLHVMFDYYLTQLNYFPCSYIKFGKVYIVIY